MATASTSSSGAVWMTCSMCLETYRDPRSLPCGHSLCDSCLNQLISTDGGRRRTIDCPSCGQPIEVPGSGLFPLDLTVMEAIEGEKSSSGKSPLVDDLHKTTESLFSDDVDEATRRLRDEISTSRADVQSQTDRRTDALFTRLTVCRNILVKARENEKLGEKPVKSDAETQADKETDIETDRQTDRLTLTRTLDTGLSGLVSMAVLRGERSDKIVVCGWNFPNCFLKCFSFNTSALLGKYELHRMPGNLAKSRDQQVVVTLQHQILYLDVQYDIRLVKTLDTEKWYDSISVLPGNRLVVCEWLGKCVDILDEGGRVIQTLNPESIPRPSCLAVRGECLLIVTDGRHSLTCVTLAGHVTWRSRDLARERGLLGVACDMEQFVYVCDVNRHCIVQLSRDGQVIRDVITADDGLSIPQSVCCVEDNLYVCQKGGDIKLFTWSKAE